MMSPIFFMQLSRYPPYANRKNPWGCVRTIGESIFCEGTYWTFLVKLSFYSFGIYILYKFLIRRRYRNVHIKP